MKPCASFFGEAGQALLYQRVLDALPGAAQLVDRRAVLRSLRAAVGARLRHRDHARRLVQPPGVQLYQAFIRARSPVALRALDALVDADLPVHVRRFDRDVDQRGRSAATSSVPLPAPRASIASMISRPLSPLRKTTRRRPPPPRRSLVSQCTRNPPVSLVNVSVCLSPRPDQLPTGFQATTACGSGRGASDGSRSGRGAPASAQRPGMVAIICALCCEACSKRPPAAAPASAHQPIMLDEVLALSSTRGRRHRGGLHARRRRPRAGDPRTHPAGRATDRHRRRSARIAAGPKRGFAPPASAPRRSSPATATSRTSRSSSPRKGSPARI